jgi:hypothetical protein
VAYTVSDVFNFCLVGAAAAYLVTVWLYSSLFARWRGYLEARWPFGPWVCRICLSLYAATSLAVYAAWAGDSPWRLPVHLLAASWLASHLASLAEINRDRNG